MFYQHCIPLNIKCVVHLPTLMQEKTSTVHGWVNILLFPWGSIIWEIFGVHPIDSDGWPETRWTWGPRILMRNVTFLVWLRRNLGSLGTIGLESVHGPNFRFLVTHFWATHIWHQIFVVCVFFCHDRENFLLLDTCSNMRFYLWGGKSFVEHLTSCVGILEFSTFTMFFF